jgi:hypothetical protein
MPLLMFLPTPILEEARCHPRAYSWRREKEHRTARVHEELRGGGRAATTVGLALK